MNRETPISFRLPTFRRFAACCLSALMVCWGLAASAQITFTGTQVSLASGSWSTPTSVAVDGADNVYVADSGSNQVLRMANTSGGLGQPVVIDTQVSNPRGVAADFYGNLFLSDSGNNRVVEVPISSEGYGSPKQLVSGLNNPSGLAVDSLGNVLVADTGNNRVIEIPVVAGGYGALEVVATGLSNPLDVAVDAARNLFVADTGNGRVIKAPFVAGQYASQQVVDSGLIPVSVFVDRYNNLFIGDGATSRLVEKTWASWANRYGIQYLLGSNLVSPSSIAVDSAGNVYVTDSGSGRLIQLVSQSLNFGAVGAGSTGSQLTYNFTVDAGTTLGGVAISMQGAVGRDFSDAGGSSCVPQTYAVATICGVNVNFQPTASGTRMGAINLFDGSGDPLATAFFSGTGVRTQAAYFPGTATQLGTQLSAPSGVAVDGAGNLFIADTGNDRVVMLPWTGSGFGSQSVLPIAGISSPMGLAIDGAGDLYIASSGNDRVFRVPKSLAGFGTPSRVGTGLDGPMGVAIDSSGLLYIADTLNARVDKLAWTGNGFGTEQEIGDVHRSPIGLAVDSVGDVYFADPYQNQLAVVDWPTILEKPQHWVPMEGVSFDAALAVDGNGNLFILDSGNNRVVMLPWTGSGFGPQETVATGFNAPLGMTIDSHGVLYVADSGNNRVVRIDFSTPGGLSFAATSVGSTSADSAKTAMVQNLGNQPMQLTSVAYPADFPEAAGGATLCAENTTLAAGQWCGIAVDFTPLSAGAPLMEAVSIGGNLLGAGQSQQAIPVSGSSVARRAQQISFASVPGVVYGAAPVSLSATASSGLPVTFTVLSGPGALAYGGQTLRVTGVGTVVVQATQAGNGQFQAAAAATVSIAVSPATLTVTPTNRNATYGSISTAFSYTITGFVLRDSVANSVTGQAALTCSASSTSAVGNYTITASQGTLAASNYIFAFAPGTLTVGKAWLHVFPAALWRSYGGSMPATNWSFTGLLNGDAPGVVTGSPLMTATANAGSPAGTYPITATVGTLAAANYAFDIRTATLTVVPAVLTVAANNLTIQYGSSIPTLTAAISGFVNGDLGGSVVGGVPALSTTATASSGAGTYPITVATGSLKAANYSFRFVNGTLTITKAVASVTPANATMTYGGPLPAFALAFSGFVHGDTAATAITGNPVAKPDANAMSKPGSYALTALAGSMASKNYSFVFGTAQITVNKAKLYIVANDCSIKTGNNLPKLSFTATGLVKGETLASATTGAPQLSTPASAKAKPGSYPIVAASGTLAASDYQIVYSNGTLTVTP